MRNTLVAGRRVLSHPCYEPFTIASMLIFHANNHDRSFRKVLSCLVYVICFTYVLHLLGFSVKMFRVSPKARSRALDKWNLTSACWTNTSQSSRTWTGIYPCCSPNFMESVSMPTYPSPKPTLPLTSHLEQNVGSGEKRILIPKGLG